MHVNASADVFTPVEPNQLSQTSERPTQEAHDVSATASEDLLETKYQDLSVRECIPCNFEHDKGNGNSGASVFFCVIA